MAYPAPKHEDAFEDFCVNLLRSHWNCEKVDRYARRGQKQNGVDILDLSGRVPLRAAQAKFHYSMDDVFDPAALLAEVERAKTFPLTIGEYTLLTNAKKSAELQVEVVRINQEHQQKGLFLVEVFTWDVIERLLDVYPTVAQTIVAVPTTVVLDGLRKQENLLTTLSEQVERSAAGGEFERDIAEVKQYLASYDFQMARLLVERIKTRSWDKLDARQRYRLLVNYAGTFQAAGALQDASKYLLEAHGYQQNDGEAAAFEALAYEMRGEDVRAHALAAEGLKKYPTQSRFAATFVRTASAPTTLTDLETAVADHSTRDAEVAVALGVAAFSKREFAKSIDYSRKATELRADWPAGFVTLGKSLLASEVEKLGRRFGELPEPISVERIREAAKVFSTAIELGKKSHATEVLFDSHVSRAKALALLGEGGGSADLEEALRLPSRSPEALTFKGQMLFNEGKRSAAIEVLRRATALGDERAEFLLAIALLSEDSEGSRAEGLGLARRIAAQPSHANACDAIAVAVRELLLGGDQQGAEQIVEQAVAELPTAMTAALRSRLAAAKGDTEGTVQCALEAQRALTPGAAATVVRTVAICLESAKRYSEAATVWKSAAAPGWFTEETKALLECAQRADLHDIVLETCRALREHEQSTPETIRIEVPLLDRYEPHKVIPVLEQHLRRFPDDQVAKVWLAWSALKFERADLATIAPEELPPPAEATTGVAEVVVHLLQRLDRVSEAVEYAYQVLRAKFGDADAHRIFLLSMMPGASPKELALPTVESVAIGTAVAYRESGEELRWVVIDDAPVLQDEVAPTAALAKELIGHRVGERITLSSRVQERAVTIEKVLHRFVYRYNDVMNQYQLRFPDQHFIWAVKFPTDERGQMDFKVLEQIARDRRRQSESALKTYGDQFLPIGALGRMLGVDTPTALANLATASDAVVKCASGTVEEQNEAFAALASRGTMVIDATAAATLILIQDVDILDRVPGQRVMSHGVVAELESFVERATPLRSFGTLHEVPGGVAFQQVSAEESARARQRLKDSVVKLKAACQIVGCPKLAALEPELRDGLVEMLGKGCAESVILASEPGTTLWSDDVFVAKFLRDQYGGRRAWTEMVFRYLSNEGLADKKRHLSAAAKLIACRYAVLPFNHEAVVEAAELAKWNPANSPLSEVLDELSRNGTDLQRVFPVVLSVVEAVCSAAALEATKNAVISALFDRIRKLDGGMSFIRAIRRYLHVAFGLNVIGLAEAMGIVDAWLALRDPTRRA